MTLIFTSCTNAPEEITLYDIEESEQVITVSRPLDENYKFTLFIEKDNELTLHEPIQGSLLGANINNDNRVNQDIRQFEEYVEKPHATYIYQMTLGEEFPGDFILTTMANRKIPNIVIRLPDYSIINYDKEIEELSKQFGQFNVPMFIQFAPVESRFNQDRYLNLYKKTREVFRVNAPNIAFVWTVNSSNVFNSMIYYPGDEYVDWVGIDAMQTIDNNSYEGFNDDIYRAIDFLYYTFQERKPVMITSFGVSHFSTVNHTYKIEEAEQELVRAYKKFISDYPRIKAINYISHDETLNNTGDLIRNNFILTRNQTIKDAYITAISDDRYLSGLDYVVQMDKSPQLIRCPFPIYRVDNDLLISARSLEYTINLSSISSAVEEIIIGGEKYYRLSDIEDSKNMTFKIDNNNRRVILIM